MCRFVYLTCLLKASLFVFHHQAVAKGKPKVVCDQNIKPSLSQRFMTLYESPQAERRQRNGGMVMHASVLVILGFIMLVLLILKENFS